jgi:carbonyl reductase 1
MYICTYVYVHMCITGPKRVTEAFVGLIDPKEGRIVNVSSSVASMWVRDQDAATKALYSNPDITWQQLNASIQANLASGVKNEPLRKQWFSGNAQTGMGAGYGLSKAGLNALTMVQAKLYPNLKVVSLSPGFIDTNMTKGFNAGLTPEQGCVSSLKCLFDPVIQGCYYGSDGLRSPLTCTRDPGMPEYEGESDPDPKKYNN